MVIGEEATDTIWNIGNSDYIYILGKKIHHGCGQTLTQIAQRRCEISILKHIQHLTGEDPEQPALSSRLEQMTPRGPFQCKLFYDNLILRGRE